MHFQIGSIEPLMGSNFPAWKNNLMIVLGLNDIDYALRVDEPKAPAQDEENYEAKRVTYSANTEKWERSNRLSRQIMKNSISEGIRGAISNNENAKVYLASVEDHYKGSSKFYATTLMERLHKTKYDASKGNVREHIMLYIDVNAQLTAMQMGVQDAFLVHFIMTSLPPEFEAFKVNYNTQKDKWSMSDLIAMCVQEEERIKAEKKDVVNQVGNGRNKGRGGGYRGKMPQKKGNQNFAPYKRPPLKNAPAPGGSHGAPHGGSSSAPGSSNEQKNTGCHLCGKEGHVRDDCPGWLKWLAKNGIPYIPKHQRKGKKPPSG